VFLHDANEAALQRGLALIAQSLDKRVERGRLDPATRAATLARIRPVTSNGELRDVGLVIEVIVEDLEAKVGALIQLESQLDPDTIVATNTSSLSVTALAGRLARPERVVGMHFFNPATVLPLVEVVSGHATDPQVAQTIVETARAWGKVPVACRSTPGFIVNRVARPFYGEALRLLQERAATPATLDAVMRECGGFKMGPCELMDLIGHDVNFAVTRSVYEAFFDDPRYKPSLIQKDLVDAGWLGRKSGRGFYDHREGAAIVLADEAGERDVPAAVTVEGDLGPASPLLPLIQAKWPQARVVEGAGLLRVDGLALALTDGRTATERSLALGEPVVLFDLALDYAGCARIAMPVVACCNPTIHTDGAPANDPSASYSSGYSPSAQTVPSRSWAKNASSASCRASPSKSSSSSTTVFTPSITLVRSVTVVTTRCSEPATDPRSTHRVPGTSGKNLLVTLGFAAKLVWSSWKAGPQPGSLSAAGVLACACADEAASPSASNGAAIAAIRALRFMRQLSSSGRSADTGMGRRTG